MFGYCGYTFAPFGIIGIILWILFWAVIIGLIVRVVRGSRWRHDMRQGRGWDRGWSEGKDPLDILRERYARGEIDKDEFEQKKADLTR